MFIRTLPKLTAALACVLMSLVAERDVASRRLGSAGRWRGCLIDSTTSARRAGSGGSKQRERPEPSARHTRGRDLVVCGEQRGGGRRELGDSAARAREAARRRVSGPRRRATAARRAHPPAEHAHQLLRRDGARHVERPGGRRAPVSARRACRSRQSTCRPVERGGDLRAEQLEAATVGAGDGAHRRRARRHHHQQQRRARRAERGRGGVRAVAEGSGRMGLAVGGRRE